MAEREGGVAAVLRASLLDRPETRLRLAMRVAVIDEVVVSGPARRQGLATALLERAEAWARAGGATRLTLQVFAGNADAIRLYERLHYRVGVHTMVRDLD